MFYEAGIRHLWPALGLINFLIVQYAQICATSIPNINFVYVEDMIEYKNNDKCFDENFKTNINPQTNNGKINMIDTILKYIARSSVLSFGLLGGIVAETFLANYLATNKKTPKFVLKVLSYHPLRLVRSFVAENTNTSPDVLLKLSKEDANMVSYFAKKNPCLPKERIELLESKAVEALPVFDAQELELITAQQKHWEEIKDLKVELNKQ